MNGIPFNDPQHPQGPRYLKTKKNDTQYNWKFIHTKKINIHLWDYESTNQNWTQFSLVQLFLLTRFIGPITSAGSTTKPPINSVLSGDSWLVFGRQNS